MNKKLEEGIREFTKEAREIYFQKHFHPSNLAEDDDFKDVVTELNYHDRCVAEMMSDDLEE